MLRGVLEAQAPPKQSATDTINTFSNRLNNATLLEDRRQAILGLRSFAKAYPASVASGGLRGLITSLTRDVDDVDTAKIVLETLLMLFHPNEDSPEASDDIALWLADEFSQRQDNITILLDFLDKRDFYTSLYSLQLLSAISSARPERTQECILSAPLGTARLVSSLDDAREAIRSAALQLLIDVTQSSFELQKIVAFENAFDLIFNLIQAEGSWVYGGVTVQDCLTLLANLLHLNSSNQSLFRETGCMAKLNALFSEKAQGGQDPHDDDFLENDVKEKNLWGLLAVVRMFLLKGSVGTQANQNAFEKHGILPRILDLAFSSTMGPPIRAEALRTCADIIRGNGGVQERFAHRQVSLHPTTTPNGDAAPQINGVSSAFVIDALLDLALRVHTSALFDVRYAACECIEAYFDSHAPIRQHFLRRAIDGFKSGQDETSNVLTILLGGPKGYQWADPYRIWFASVLALRLLFDDSETKKMLEAVNEGDASQGEEVVSCIQVMTGNLIGAVQDGEDERVSIGYLMLLCTWMFEDVEAVDDLLSEGSTVQSLVQIASKGTQNLDLSRGLCTILLGTLYEFSTKDSPIPRRKLQPLLTNGIGREFYGQRIQKLRENPYVRDFEVLPQDSSAAAVGELPEVYFDSLFVDFVKDNFSRFTKAIDRDPGLEVARLHEGVDRDLVDSLRSQLEDKVDALQKADSEVLNLGQRLGHEQADGRKAQETLSAEISRIKSINDALQKSHDAEIERLESKHQTEQHNIRDQHARQTQATTAQAQKSHEDATKHAKAIEEQYQQRIKEVERRLSESETKSKHLRETIQSLQQTGSSNEQVIKQKDSEIQSLKDGKQVLEESIELNTVNVRKLEDQIRDTEARLKEAREKQSKLQTEVESKEEARKGAQTELDDLLIVLGDLEEKRTRDKKKLKELGADTSDDEGDEEDEDEVEEEDDEDGGEGDEDINSEEEDTDEATKTSDEEHGENETKEGKDMSQDDDID